MQKQRSGFCMRRGFEWERELASLAAAGIVHCIRRIDGEAGECFVLRYSCVVGIVKNF
jgi:hypothetical protein